MANWIQWSRWFEVASDDENIGALEHSLMVHIAGWADNVGTGWGIDDSIIAQLARRLNTSPDKIDRSLDLLQRRGYIALTDRDGRTNLGVDRRQDAA